MKTHPDDSNLDTPNSTGTHVQIPSQPEMNNSLASEMSNRLQESKRSQEDISDHHTNSPTPPPTQNQDAKQLATLPVSTSLDIHGSSTSMLSQGIPKSRKKAAPSMSSKTLASALERFYRQSKLAKHAYWRLSKIFEKTRTKMFHKSYNSFIMASRGFDRGMLPTRRTKPPLLKRRYSVDVNMYEVDRQSLVSDLPEESEVCIIDTS